MKAAIIGRMRDRVTIQQKTTTTDTQLGRSVSWGTLATVWANVRPWPRAGGETIRAQAITAQMDYEVEIRYRADVTPTMRVLWTPYDGSQKTLEIFEATPKDGRRERLLLQCSEVG